MKIIGELSIFVFLDAGKVIRLMMKGANNQRHNKEESMGLAREQELPLLAARPHLRNAGPR